MNKVHNYFTNLSSNISQYIHLGQTPTKKPWELNILPMNDTQCRRCFRTLLRQLFTTMRHVDNYRNIPL